MEAFQVTYTTGLKWSKEHGTGTVIDISISGMGSRSSCQAVHLQPPQFCKESKMHTREKSLQQVVVLAAIDDLRPMLSQDPKQVGEGTLVEKRVTPPPPRERTGNERWGLREIAQMHYNINAWNGRVKSSSKEKESFVFIPSIFCAIRETQTKEYDSTHIKLLAKALENSRAMGPTKTAIWLRSVKN